MFIRAAQTDHRGCLSPGTNDTGHHNLDQSVPSPSTFRSKHPNFAWLSDAQGKLLGFLDSGQISRCHKFFSLSAWLRIRSSGSRGNSEIVFAERKPCAHSLTAALYLPCPPRQVSGKELNYSATGRGWEVEGRGRKGKRGEIEVKGENNINSG